jgi:hypothetical protein
MAIDVLLGAWLLVLSYAVWRQAGSPTPVKYGVSAPPSSMGREVLKTPAAEALVELRRAREVLRARIAEREKQRR